MYNADWLPDAVRRIARRRGAGKPLPSIVWQLGATSLFMDLSAEMVASVLPFYLVRRLQMGTLAFGALDGVQQLARIASIGVGGYVADRLRRPKAIAVIGYVLSMFTRLGWLVLAPVWAMAAALVSTDQVGKGLRTAPRDALIAGAVSRADVGRAFGLHRSLDAGGALLGPFAAFALLAAASGRTSAVFTASTAAAVIGVAIIALFVRDPRARPQPAFAGPSAAPVVRDVLTSRVALGAFVLAAASLSDSWIFLMVQGHASLGITSFPLLFAGMNLAYFVLAVPVGIAADRFGKAGIFLAGHVLLLAGYSLLMVNGVALRAWWVMPILLGAFYASTDGVLPSLAAGWLPEARRAGGLAILGMAGGGGRLVASVGFGFLIGAAGETRALTVYVGVLTVAILAAFALIKPLFAEARAQ